MTTSADFRLKFPIFDRLTYLNSCSKGALALPVASAVQDFMGSWEQSGSPWEVWADKAREARQSFAALIGADTEEVGICFSASDGIASVASALDFTKQPKVVTTPFEFPTVHYVWQAQASRGARLWSIRPDENQLRLERYVDAIDATTSVVTATLVCYRNGFRTAWLHELAEAAHRHNAYLFLDAYQGLGTIPIDVKALDIDFLVAGSLKYLLGLPGAAFIYVRRELIASLQPTITGWQAQTDGFAESLNFAPDARRFQTGTLANISLYAAAAGTKLVGSVGVQAIQDSTASLAEHLILGAQEQGLEVLTAIDPAKRGPLVAIRVADSAGLVKAMARDGIIVSHRSGALRVSLHHYNNHNDIDGVLDSLRTNRKFVRAA